MDPELKRRLLERTRQLGLRPWEDTPRRPANPPAESSEASDVPADSVAGGSQLPPVPYGLKKNAVPVRNLGRRNARQCRKKCKHSGNSACSERTTQSLVPEPPTADSPVELEIISFKVITGIDVDENADAHSASPPASPAFEYEKSPDSMLLEPSEEDAEIPACPDNFLLRHDGSESRASEGRSLDHSNSESDSDDEVATMMNIDTLPLEGLRTSLRDLYRKYRRLKAVYLDTVRLLEESSGKVSETAQLLEESTGKVERLEATLDELRARRCDAS